MGRVGVPHPRPAPWALGVVSPLADPAVQLLVQLREFLFLNPVRFYGSLNPNFFTGTAIEREAADVLSA